MRKTGVFSVGSLNMEFVGFVLKPLCHCSREICEGADFVEKWFSFLNTRSECYLAWCETNLLQFEVHLVWRCICFTHSQASAAVQVTTGVSSGFWVMIDMLSGRYLYQNLKGQTQVKGEKSMS